MVAAVSATSRPSKLRSTNSCLWSPVHCLVDRIGRVLLVVGAPWHIGHHAVTDAAPSLHVAYSIFQDAIEQRAPFLRRPGGVARAQLQHRVLHHVERIGFVTQRDLCDPESLALHARQKRFERARGILGRISQMGLPGRDQFSRQSIKTSKGNHATASILSEATYTQAQRR